MDQFKDIRPFTDEEAPAVIKRLLANNPLLDSLAKFYNPRLYALFGPALRPLSRFLLPLKIKNIESFQKTVIKKCVERIIQRTTSGVTSSGLENLPESGTFLFLSTHRDIVLDPALLNFMLNQAKRKTVQIAIGDNLIQQDYISDLMRLNKSFLVKRSLTNTREKLKAYHQLSAFIHHTIEEENSVWIAHREGRAKDGNDQTDPALIKMLHMSQKAKHIPISEMVDKLSIVPVAISYEYDPCDIDKARELFIKDQGKPYEKKQNEDLNSILKGFNGWKGNVHIAFGKPLKNLLTAQSIATAVDSQIYQLFRLYPSHYAAYELLRETKAVHLPPLPSSDLSLQKAISLGKMKLAPRLNDCPKEYQNYLLTAYANPVINQYQQKCNNKIQEPEVL